MFMCRAVGGTSCIHGLVSAIRIRIRIRIRMFLHIRMRMHMCTRSCMRIYIKGYERIHAGAPRARTCAAERICIKGCE
jgi:hypothetical protein